MGIKSNLLASAYYNFFGATGKDSAGSNIAGPFSASGGNIDGITPGNGYAYHVFTSPGNFTVPSDPGEAEVEGLIIGGGGGGGRQHAGGGGAGSVVHFKLPASAPILGTNAVTVGGGGNAAPWPGGADQPGTPGSDGNNTTITFPGSTPYNITANGGGGGQANNGPHPTGGGSGGGAYNSGGPEVTATAPTTSPAPAAITDAGGKSYQNPSCPGGNPDSPGSPAGGGGGGAGGVGQKAGNPGQPNANPTVQVGGNGGAGQPFPGFAGPLFPTMPTDWQAATGPTGIFAGGAGAGGHGTGPVTPNGGLGGGVKTEPGAWTGSGGGGAGGGYASPEPTSTSGNAGLDNTGGGGGGGASNDTGASNGGPGVVIIRYLV